MKKINRVLALFAVSIVGIGVFFVSKAYAKPISNTLQASINVTGLEVSVGEGQGYEFSSLNTAISKVKDGGIVKIKGGQYDELQPLLDRNVTLQSADGGYVDIIVPNDVSQYKNLKVGDKVTVNQEGVAPLILKAALIRENNSIGELGTSDITFDADKDKDVKIYLEKEVVNPLGFHNMTVMLKINSDSGVIVKKRADSIITTITPDANNNYNLGNMTSNQTIVLLFQKAGEYRADFWLDDGR